jgi:hypothetical protein
MNEGNFEGEEADDLSPSQRPGYKRSAYAKLDDVNNFDGEGADDLT